MYRYEAAALIKSYMEDAGLTVWMDEIGNVRGRTPVGSCIDDDAPVLLLGSHFDTGISKELIEEE